MNNDPDWVKCAMSSVDGFNSDQINKIIDDTDNLSSNGQFEEIDRGLKLLDPHKMNTYAILAVVRNLYRKWLVLNNYTSFIKQVLTTEVVKQNPTLLSKEYPYL